MKEFSGGILVLAVIFGFGFYVGAVAFSKTVTYERGRQAKQLIEECEQPLLRTVSCKIVAVPDKKGENDD